MTMKRKGTHYERELVHLLWDEGFAAIRSAGSGSMQYPSPDILAGNGAIFLAIEVKVREKLPLYISAEKLRELVMFSNLFGAKPIIALKVKKEKWRFFELEMLEETKKGYKITQKKFFEGKELGEILNKYRQERL
ncbi:Holliday junction resolvase Hjc [Geoglobus acetivorans]